MSADTHPGFITAHSHINAWECDEIGHYNVRFYLRDKGDADAHARRAFGLPAVNRPDAKTRITTTRTHVRYHGELRFADAGILRSSVVEVGISNATIFHELRNAVTDKLATTFVTEWRHQTTDSKDAPWSDDVRAAMQAHIQPLPDLATKRSLGIGDPVPELTLNTLNPNKTLLIRQSVVRQEQCDFAGTISDYGVMTHASDGAPHFWANFGMDWPSLQAKRQGHIMLEGLFDHRRALKAGDPLIIRSVIRGVERKTIRFAHMLFHGDSGALAHVYEGTVALFDLDKRKTVALPDEAREHCAALLADW